MKTMAKIRRKIVEPLYAAYTGSVKIDYWKELERAQFQPIEKIRETQFQRFKSLINFIWENNRFYRDRLEKAGVAPASIKSINDIRKIPILSKTEVQQNTEAMISDGFLREQLLEFKTGGSTGKPLRIYITEECSEKRNAMARRNDRWSGWEPGEPVGAVWGNPPILSSIKDYIKWYLLEPRIFFDTMKASEALAIEFARQWKRLKPTLLFGHAHSIYLLASFIKKLGISEINPRAIISSSMMLLPHERKFIENVFGVKVTDRYGCEEVSLIASECEQHNGMHLNMEHLIIEFIKENGTPAEPGEAGKIIVTDLLNKAMPFIRYSVEDVGVPSQRECPCGRQLPLMEKVAGRVADFLKKADGTQVAGISLIENTLTKMPGIAQMQLIQENYDELIVNVVPGDSFSDSTEQELKKYFEVYFEISGGVIINRMNEIKPESNGKFRFSVCKL